MQPTWQIVYLIIHHIPTLRSKQCLGLELQNSVTGTIQNQDQKLSNSPVRSELVSLLEDGSADEIAEWLEAPGIPETVRTILRQGLRGETDFDAVEVGRLAWDDHLGTLTQCSAIRQSDGKVMYQVMQDGDLIAEFLSSRELSGVKVRNLMVTGDIEDDDYTGYASFRASSNYHSDLHSWEGSQEDE